MPILAQMEIQMILSISQKKNNKKLFHRFLFQKNLNYLNFLAVSGIIIIQTHLSPDFIFTFFESEFKLFLESCTILVRSPVHIPNVLNPAILKCVLVQGGSDNFWAIHCELNLLNSNTNKSKIGLRCYQ